MSDRGATETSDPQAESRLRPLSRRRLMTARPARVRIRLRKPCLRLRRRTFGWYVRFMEKTHRGGKEVEVRGGRLWSPPNLVKDERARFSRVRRDGAKNPRPPRNIV